MAFAQCTMKRRNGEETLAYVKECDAEMVLYTVVATIDVLRQHVPGSSALKGGTRQGNQGTRDLERYPGHGTWGARAKGPSQRNSPVSTALAHALPLLSLNSASCLECGLWGLRAGERQLRREIKTDFGRHSHVQ